MCTFGPPGFEEFYSIHDLSGATPGLTCRKITLEEALRLGWSVVRALKNLDKIIVPFEP